LRFAVRRPGIPEASPRSHRVPHGDILCRVNVRVEREVAGHAGKEGLALAALRCDAPARRASLASECGFYLLNPAGRLIFQASYQQPPARPQDSPVQPGLLPDVFSRIFGGSPSRASHAPDAEIFDTDHIELTRQFGGGLLHPVSACIRLARLKAGDGQLHLGAAARAAPGARQLALKRTEPTLPRRAEPGNPQKLTSGQRRTDRHATVDAYHLARTRSGNRLGNQGERDMPAARPVPGHPIGLRRGHCAGPTKPYPACFRDPQLAGLAGKPSHVPGLHCHDTETLIAPRFPPCEPAVSSREEVSHGLGEVAQCLLLDHLGAVAQPRIRSAGGGELAALVPEAWSADASGPPPGLLLDRKVPHKPRVCAMILQHCLLNGRWEQAVSGHANTIANATDIPGEVRRRSFPGIKARVSASQI